MSDENHGHDHGYSHPHTHSYTHAHDHDHGGDHEHNHDHAHECNHGHDHGDGHTHSHEHDHDQGGDLAKFRALLKYMLDHNREHTGELGDLAHNLFHAGQGESADSIHEAVKDFESGNEKLAKALALIKDGK